MNKDGYADYCLNSFYRESSSGDDQIWRTGGEGTHCGINKGDGTFFPATQWSDHATHRSRKNNIKTRYIDIDDDKYTDLCVQTETKLTCWINNQSNRFSQQYAFNVGFSKPAQSFLVDIDGDGRRDMCGLGRGGFECYLNTSTANVISFSGKQTWSSHAHFASAANNNTTLHSLRIADFNADALADICYINGDHLYCAINNGNRFVSVNQISSIALSADGGWGPVATETARNLQMVDINHDGHVDACTHFGSGTYNCAYNNGNGTLGLMQQYAQFDPMLDVYDLPGYGRVVGSPEPITFVDVNADAKIDVCYHSRSGVSCALSEAVAGANLLKGVTTPYKTTTFEYTVLSGAENYLPATTGIAGMLNISPSLVALQAVVTDNPAGGKNTLEYHYEGLRYDLEDGMRAFEKITKTLDANNRTTVSEFHQQGKLNGRVKRSTVFVEGSKINENNYTYRQVNTGKAYQIRNIETIATTYDLNGNLLKTHTKTFSDYDRFGNPTTATETTVGNGEYYEVITSTQFSNSEHDWLIARPLHVNVQHTTNSGSSIRKNVAFVYDSKGALIEKTTEPGHALALTSKFTYGSFGNKIKITLSDIHGNTRTSNTSYAPNGVNRLSESNALGHTQTFVYDSFCNQPLSTTGPNGLMTSWQYDGLCRKIFEQRADGTSTQISYNFSEGYQPNIGVDNTSKFTITTQNSGTAANRVYFDAFGNVTRTSKKGFNGKTVLEDKIYDARGLLVQQTLPYYEGMFAGNNASWISTSYDLLGRKISQSRESAEGPITVNFSYNGFAATTTDALYNQ